MSNYIGLNKLEFDALGGMELTLFFMSSRRPDISEGLRKLQCRSLIFVGDSSPFHSEALYMTSKLDRRYSALVEV